VTSRFANSVRVDDRLLPSPLPVTVIVSAIRATFMCGVAVADDEALQRLIPSRLTVLKPSA